MTHSLNPHCTDSAPLTEPGSESSLPDSPPSRAPADQGTREQGIREGIGESDSPSTPPSSTSTHEPDTMDGSTYRDTAVLVEKVASRPVVAQARVSGLGPVVVSGPVSPVDLAAVEARANAASTGPWETRTRRTADPFDPYRPDAILVTQHGVENVARAGSVIDAEFIAHARSDVPALVAEVKRLREACAELVETLNRVTAERGAFRDERNEARERIRRVELAHCWTSEDGKRFVFADDLRAALDGAS